MCRKGLLPWGRNMEFCISAKSGRLPSLHRSRVRSELFMLPASSLRCSGDFYNNCIN